MKRYGLRGVLEVYGSLVKIHGRKDSKKGLKNNVKLCDVHQQAPQWGQNCHFRAKKAKKALYRKQKVILQKM
jgi:hypothetical protein